MLASNYKGGLGSRYFVHEYVIPIFMIDKKAKFEGAFIMDSVLNFDPRPNVQEIPNDIRGVSIKLDLIF